MATVHNFNVQPDENPQHTAFVQSAEAILPALAKILPELRLDLTSWDARMRMVLPLRYASPGLDQLYALDAMVQLLDKLQPYIVLDQYELKQDEPMVQFIWWLGYQAPRYEAESIETRSLMSITTTSVKLSSILTVPGSRHKDVTDRLLAKARGAYTRSRLDAGADATTVIDEWNELYERAAAVSA